jgi:hypothetical protein
VEELRRLLTTLEADVHETLYQFNKIQPCQIRNILIKKYQGSVCFSKGRTLDVQISRVLKRLMAKGFVKKPVKIKNEMFYSLTSLGRKKAPFSIISSRVEDKQYAKKNLGVIIPLPNLFKLTIRNASSQKIDAQTIETINKIMPTEEAIVNTLFYLDPKNQDKIDKIILDIREPLLENIAYQFVTKCQRALAKTVNAYQWNDYKSGPLQIEKLIENFKASLNFDAVLALHFNGKRIIEEHNWEKDVQKFKDHDRNEREIRNVFDSKVSEQGKARESWIDWCILEELRRAKQDLDAFDLARHLIGSDVGSALTKFAEHIVSTKQAGEILHDGPTPPNVDAVKKHLKKLMDDGVLELAVTFKVNTEKIAKKKNAAADIVCEETGYVLP